MLNKEYFEQGYSYPYTAISELDARYYFNKYLDVEQTLGLQNRKTLNLINFKTHTVFPWCRDLIFNENVLNIVSSIVGNDILCLSSTFFAKQPRNMAYTSWHQDHLYYKSSNDDAIASIWLGLTDTTVESGCMAFVKGGDKKEREHVLIPTDKNMLIKGQTVLQEYATENEYVEMAAGQFSVHHLRSLHSSPPNKSNKYRVGLVMRYCSPDTKIGMFSNATAVTCRGENTNPDYWGEDYIPTEDYDKVGMEKIKETIADYRKQQSSS